MTNAWGTSGASCCPDRLLDLEELVEGRLEEPFFFDFGGWYICRAGSSGFTVCDMCMAMVGWFPGMASQAGEEDSTGISRGSEDARCFL
jgi:hypothetical protein